MTDLPVKYYEEYLMKKEGKGKWKDYWVVIRGSWILFYANKNITDKINFRGSLELCRETKCSVSKRRNYSFPFYITTHRGTHLFKCSTNLQRHQWIYVIGLALKGAPAISPPSFVPKATVQDSDGEYLSSWDMSSSPNKISDDLSEDSLSNIIDDDDDDDEKDDDDDGDLSLPPGVIIVSTLPNDLSKMEGDAEKTNERELILNSINTDHKEQNVPLNAVMTTGITGSTCVVRGKIPGNETKSNRLQLPNPMLIRPVSKSTGAIHDGQFRKYSMSPQSSQESRPSTSPLLSTSRKQHLSHFPANSTVNLKFSRHMTNSAPDVKTLACDSIIRRA